MQDSLGIYLREIGSTPLLTKEEECKLTRAMQRGRDAQAKLDAGENSSLLHRRIREGVKAKEQFLRANLRLVVSIAKRYPLPDGLELLDLIQEGNLGLERAVEKYDSSMGHKFSTYASHWIRRFCSDAVAQNASSIKLPNTRAASLHAALRSQRNTKDKKLDADAAALQRLTSVRSLNERVGHDSDEGLELHELCSAETTTPEDMVLELDQTAQMQDLLRALAPKDRAMLDLRYGFRDGEQRTYQEIGEMVGCSHENVRKSINKSLGTLRQRGTKLGLVAA